MCPCIFCLSVVVDCVLSEFTDMAAYGGTLVTDSIVRTFDQCLAHCVRMVKSIIYYIAKTTSTIQSEIPF